MRCSGCGKPMRDYGITRDEAPGTVPRGGREICQTCVNHRGGKLAEAPPSDEPCVPVKALLRPSTYRVFAGHAKAMGLEVGDLLSRLADRAVKPADLPVAPKTRRPRAEDAIDARIRELNAQHMNDTEIAKIIGMSQPSTSGRRRRLGLESPTPKGGRRKAA